MVPPCRSTMARAIESPKPLPETDPGVRALETVYVLVNMWGSASGAIPHPLSETDMIRLWRVSVLFSLFMPALRRI